jgi:hypothetical protein
MFVLVSKKNFWICWVVLRKEMQKDLLRFEPATSNQKEVIEPLDYGGSYRQYDDPTFVKFN